MSSMRKTQTRARRGRRQLNRRGKAPVMHVIQSRRDPSYPPQNNVRPIFVRTLRYYVGTASSNVDITGRCLLNLVLGTNTATTLAINVYEAVRVNSVSMYFVPTSTGGFGTTADELQLNWRGERSPDVRLSDRGTLSHPACIKSRPPKDSLAQFWVTNQSNLDTVLFALSAPSSTIIDLQLAMTIGDGATRSVTLTAAGSNTGVQYTHLDNAIAAGTVGPRLITPDSLTLSSILTP